MNPGEMAAGQLNWVGRSVAHNLDYIPDDKLDWKPAPTAKSALEIINHAATALYGMLSRLDGGDGKPGFTPASNREEAKALLGAAVAAYSARLQDLQPADMEGEVQLRLGKVPKAMAVGLPVLDLTHHHGQIAYIQTLLGDTEDHLQI